MSTEELQELQEHAEHAQHNPSLAPVSLTMAVLAVLVAVVALLGHRAHTEEVVLQAKASDQWSYYQAKNIRQHQDELFADLAAAVTSKDDGQMAKFRDKSSQEADRYKHEKDEIQDKAHELEREVATERNRADRYDLAEVFLEIGLVITSITLLSGRRIFWHSGMVLSVIGLALALTAVAVH
jgi:glutamine synthetase type III